jgi:hypothetical protein
MFKLNSPSNRRMGRRAALAAVMASTLLAGCANLVGASNPEAVVKERAQQRWQALIGSDFAKAYAYTAPSYRALVSADTYRKGFGSGGWVSADVQSVNCDTDKCTVRLKIDMKPPMGTRFGSTIGSYVDETWILEDRQWWLFLKI